MDELLGALMVVARVPATHLGSEKNVPGGPSPGQEDR